LLARETKVPGTFGLLLFQKNLKEVVELCLEEMDSEDKNLLSKNTMNF